MAILILDDIDEAASWKQALSRYLPQADIRVSLDEGDPADVKALILWDDFSALPVLTNLKMVVVLGAGVDHLFESGVTIPKSVQVCRLVNPSITSQMVEWVTLAVLVHNRSWDEYRSLQRQRLYTELTAPHPSKRLIGILGLGMLGREVALTLKKIGYRVKGWSNSPKVIDQVECFYGIDGLSSLLSEVDMLICMLPLTEQTRGILNSDLFAKLKTGTYLINAGRGAHLVEEDLLAAVDSGQISGATLDVQSIEPLPQDHPFWDHTQIKITPHIATVTFAEEGAEEVAENYVRLSSGKDLSNVIDLDRQY
tara:strand:+ start:275 stop:1204 length:930 start_codon:yes stop_codon:yes gene_type:complete